MSCFLQTKAHPRAFSIFYYSNSIFSLSASLAPPPVQTSSARLCERGEDFTVSLIPFSFRAWMSLLYEMPSGEAALMRIFQSARISPFLSLRWANEYLRRGHSLPRDAFFLGTAMAIALHFFEETAAELESVCGFFDSAHVLTENLNSKL